MNTQLTITDILEDACRKHKEQSLSEFFGETVTLTNHQFKALCKAELDAEREQEIELAIELLKSQGYAVTK